MPADWNEDRWGKPSYNEAGDRVFTRTTNVPSSQVDVGSLTKAELQDRCTKLGLPTTGNKADLVERLGLA